MNVDVTRVDIHLPKLVLVSAIENLYHITFPIATFLGSLEMSGEACCTCATLLSTITPQYDEKTEKPIAQDQRLSCCGRVICGSCILVRKPSESEDSKLV